MTPLDDRQALLRYAPGKWSVKEVVGHLTDTERIFTTRALHFARGATTPLPGFDQDVYVLGAKFDHRAWADLIEDLELARRSTLAFFRSLDDDMVLRTGVAEGNRFTVRAIPYIVAGHELHHRRVLEERYL